MAKAINRQSETKFVSSYVQDTAPNQYIQIGSSVTGSGQWAPAIAELAMGDTDYMRTGSVIQPRQLKVAVDVRFRDEVAAYPHDITVVCYYGYCKKYRNYADIQANSADLCDQLLRLGGITAGGAETQSFNGIQSDSHLVINNAVWSLKKLTFRLHKAPGILNGSSAAGVLSAGSKNNHAFMLVWDPPEKIRYDDKDDVLPSDYAPVWTLGYYYNDSTAPDGTGAGIVEYQANRFLTFKDM